MKEILPRPYVETERRRVFEPDASFARRVVSRMRPVSRSAAAVWDYIPGFARPMVAATTLLLLLLISLQIAYPEPPPDGIVDAYLRVDSAPAEEWLYRDAELPQGQDLLMEITIAEDLQ